MPRCSYFKRKDPHENQTSLCHSSRRMPLRATQLSADEIIDWNNVLLDAIRTNSISPLPGARISAAMNTAMFDAVNSIARTHYPYHVDLTADPGTSRQAAAAQAAHRVLSGLFPAGQATYDAALANSLSGVPDGPGKTAGIELGNTVAPQSWPYGQTMAPAPSCHTRPERNPASGGRLHQRTPRQPPRIGPT